MWLKILAIVFYIIALILVFFYWVSGISVIGLIGNCIGFLGLVLSLCILIANVRKKKGEGKDSSQP